MVEDYQDRLNISVPVSCLKAIDDVIAKEGLFSGRSDFLYAAIRSMYSAFLGQFTSIYYRLNDSDATSLEKYSQLKETMKNNGSYRLHEFSKKYSGPCVKQIPIRPNSTAYQFIDQLSRYLFQEDDVDRIQKLCRISLLEYIESNNDSLQAKKVFEKKYKDLREKASKSKIIIEYIDPDNPPE